MIAREAPQYINVTHSPKLLSMPGANIIGVAYRGKQNLYAENNGWTDIYFFELRKNKTIINF